MRLRASVWWLRGGLGIGEGWAAGGGPGAGGCLGRKGGVFGAWFGVGRWGFGGGEVGGWLRFKRCLPNMEQPMHEQLFCKSSLWQVLMPQQRKCHCLAARTLPPMRNLSNDATRHVPARQDLHKYLQTLGPRSCCHTLTRLHV